MTWIVSGSSSSQSSSSIYSCCVLWELSVLDRASVPDGSHLHCAAEQIQNTTEYRRETSVVNKAIRIALRHLKFCFLTFEDIKNCESSYLGKGRERLLEYKTGTQRCEIQNCASSLLDMSSLAPRLNPFIFPQKFMGFRISTCGCNTLNSEVMYFKMYLEKRNLVQGSFIFMKHIYT